jgi:transcription-repair coupling factor (superfamily II helicase)
LPTTCVFFLGAEKAALQQLFLYPAWDVPAFEGVSPSSEILAAQVEGLYALASLPAPLIVTTIDAIAQRVMPQEDFFYRDENAAGQAGGLTL